MTASLLPWWEKVAEGRMRGIPTAFGFAPLIRPFGAPSSTSLVGWVETQLSRAVAFSKLGLDPAYRTELRNLDRGDAGMNTVKRRSASSPNGSPRSGGGRRLVIDFGG